jgi:hypothetical protein
MIWLAVLWLFAGPFWESKAPSDWTQDELVQIFTDSPWAQPLTGPPNAPPIPAYIASAGPMEQAERERERRMKKKPGNDPLAEEYRVWLEDNRATQIVLAIPVADFKAFANAGDTRRMEDESIMRVGRKKIKMTGHFPPSASDPYLRLAFPREVTASDKTVIFELYVPGIPIPFRSVEFRVKDMILRGKLEI